MMATLVLMLKAVLLVYLAFFLLLSLGFMQSSPSRERQITGKPNVSVVIAFRNEREKIPILLGGLLSQDFPPGKLEIILVDDHSDDDSWQQVELFSHDFARIKKYALPAGREGKKEAIRMGVSMATGSLIITTDADCLLPMKWISSMVSFYSKTGAKLIIGPVKYAGPIGKNKAFGTRLFMKLQALEFTSLVSAGAALAKAGRPILCNGANLAFEKSIYPCDPGVLVPETPSGDDMFLLLHAKRNATGLIRFLQDQEAIVEIMPHTRFGTFLAQKARWASKAKYFRDRDVILTGLLVVFSNTALLLSFLLPLYAPKLWPVPVILLSLKTIADYIFLLPWLGFFRQDNLARFIPLVEILYPIYMLLSLAASMNPRLKWKNRRLSA